MNVEVLSLVPLTLLLVFILVNWVSWMTRIVLCLLTSHIDSLILRDRSLDSLRVCLILEPQRTHFIVLLLAELISHRYWEDFCSCFCPL